MIYSIVSYNSTNINDGSNYLAQFDAALPYGQGKTTVVESARHAAPPVAVDKVFLSKNFKLYITLLGTFPTQQATLKALFDTRDRTLRTLIVKDTANSDKQWSIQCYCVGHGDDTDNATSLMIFEMYTPEPVWTSVTQFSDAWSITATGQTRNITPGGTVRCQPIYRINPTSTKGGGFAYFRFARWYNPGANLFSIYPLDITNGGLDTATLVSGGKMQADCDDLRVFVDGKEANRWIQSPNNAATKVWISLRLSAKKEATLNAMLIGDTTLTFQNTSANQVTFSKLPTKGIAVIENEVISWTGKTRSAGTAGKLTGLTRGAKQSTAAGHSAAVVFHWLEHEIVMAYGDATLAAPTTDDTQKPIIALTSTNTSWVYPGDGFGTAAGKRAGEWKPSVLASLASAAYRITHFYTATGVAIADPFSAMGMQIASWLSKTLPTGENAQVEWRLSHPAGITTVTATGQGKRTSVSWPAVADLQYSNDGRNWTPKWTEAAPTNDSAFHAWASHSAVALGATYKFLRFLFSGSVGSGVGNEADNECNTITLTLDSATVPQGALGGEWASAYHLAGTLTNNTTGDAIGIDFAMRYGQTLEIDTRTDSKKVTYLEDNTPQYAAISGRFSSVRQSWLELLGGVQNTLQYDDPAGTGNITLTTLYNDRQN